MEKIYILLYGGDTCFSGKRLGLESLIRLRELLRYIFNNPQYQFEILLAAGSHPVHKEYPLLKILMEDRLLHFLRIMKKMGAINYMPAITLIGPDVWNTSNESLATALFLKKLGVTKLLVVSSETHRRRIMYIWKLIGGFTIQFISAPTANEWYSVCYEVLAIIKVYLKDRKLLQQQQFSTFQASKTLAIDY